MPSMLVFFVSQVATIRGIVFENQSIVCGDLRMLCASKTMEAQRKDVKRLMHLLENCATLRQTRESRGENNGFALRRPWSLRKNDPVVKNGGGTGTVTVKLCRL